MTARDRSRCAPPAAAARSRPRSAIIIATGSESSAAGHRDRRDRRIVSSTGALALASVPGEPRGGRRRLYRARNGLGVAAARRSKVTVVEFLDRITARHGRRALIRLAAPADAQGFAFRLGTKVAEAKSGNDGVTLGLEPAAGGERESIEGRRGAGVDRAPALYRAASASTSWQSRSTTKGRIKTDASLSPPTSPASTPSATSSPARCWRTRRRRRAWPLAERLAGQKPGSITTRSRRWSTPGPKWLRSARPRRSSKPAGLEYKVGQVPVLRQRPRPRQRRSPRASSRFWPMPKATGCLGVHIIGPRRRHDHRRSRGGDGIRRQRRGYRPHLPRPSDLERGGEGGGAGGRRASDPYLGPCSGPGASRRRARSSSY